MMVVAAAATATVSVAAKASRRFSRGRKESARRPPQCQQSYSLERNESTCAAKIDGQTERQTEKGLDV